MKGVEDGTARFIDVVNEDMQRIGLIKEDAR